MRLPWENVVWGIVHAERLREEGGVGMELIKVCKMIDKVEKNVKNGNACKKNINKF